MNFDCFETCKNLSAQTKSSFPKDYVLEIMSNLSQDFDKRFENFNLASEEIKLFQNPLNCDIDNVPAELQLKSSN